ncbi:unnamed protein product [Notodromas monacha]|uniref:STIM1/2 EF-hand domain-containing protein n=1 Tax=Notodromas monacha TaxID=399045 RepID=A0A7R9BZG8_9CRUS|nr:unnamed protein product [Notodromas monacha]CAG0924187.1 unnamed protein product [Notodromas monacha]
MVTPSRGSSGIRLSHGLVVVVSALAIFLLRLGSSSSQKDEDSIGDRPMKPKIPTRMDVFMEALCEGTNDEQCYLDRLEYEAIRALHRQLDDDANGDVDISESNDFLREELQLEGGSSVTRQQAFHKNDKLISVQDLWLSWIHSELTFSLLDCVGSVGEENAEIRSIWCYRVTRHGVASRRPLNFPHDDVDRGTSVTADFHPSL